MQRSTANEGEAGDPADEDRPGGAHLSVSRTTPMRDLEGKLLGAVSVLEDVTEMQDIDRFKDALSHRCFSEAPRPAGTAASDQPLHTHKSVSPGRCAPCRTT